MIIKRIVSYIASIEEAITRLAAAVEQNNVLRGRENAVGALFINAIDHHGLDKRETVINAPKPKRYYKVVRMSDGEGLTSTSMEDISRFMGRTNGKASGDLYEAAKYCTPIKSRDGEIYHLLTITK